MPPVCPAYGRATPDLRPTKPAILRVADRPNLLSRDTPALRRTVVDSLSDLLT
jgi:hypothetical protein